MSLESKTTEGIEISKKIKLIDLERLAIKYGINFKEVEWTFNQAGRIFFAEHQLKNEEDMYDCLNHQYASALSYINHHVKEKQSEAQ